MTQNNTTNNATVNNATEMENTVMNLFGLALDIAGTIEEKYDVKADVQRVKKNNDVELIGITVRNGNSNVAPNVYIEDLVKRYGNDIDAIADKVYEISTNHSVPDMDMNWITDFEQVKEKLFAVLVNINANKERLENIPCYYEMDLAIIYKIKIDDMPESIATVTVTNELMDKWGVDIYDLHNVAMENTPVMFPYYYEDMEKVLREMMGIPEGFELPDFGGMPLMNVLSNESKTNGAIAILYPNLLKEIGNGKNLIIIPSSIHECIILDYDKYIDQIDEMNVLIQEVNANEVAPDEVLSGHYYIYNAKTKLLTNCQN